jgi:ssDNA-binding Zn-finger/Zn-ribbon topoisomerase 1
MKNKKRKIIVLHQEDLIVCDNPKCDFKIKNETGEFDEETIQYVNMPCPKCGENLLTEKDYLDAMPEMW